MPLRRMARPKGRRRPSPALLSMLLASAPSVCRAGPAMPGDDDYYVQLKDIELAEGELDPAFDKDTYDYTIKLNDVKLPSEKVRLVLDLDKYNLMYVPFIFVDDAKFEYTPLNPIEPTIVMNETIGPVDRWVAISIADPKASSGWNAHLGTYNLHMIQPPYFDKVVQAQSIVVRSINQTAVKEGIYDDYLITPSDEEFNPEKSEYAYFLPDKTDKAKVFLNCTDFATGVAFDGKQHELGYQLTVDMSKDAVRTIIGQCLYKDERWSKGAEYQRTYSMRLVSSAHLGNASITMIIPQGQGVCTMVDVDNWEGGWKCKTAMAAANMIAIFKNPQAEVHVVNNATRLKYRMHNSFPTMIPVTSTGDFRVEFTAGTDIKVIPLWMEHKATTTFQPGHYLWDGPTTKYVINKTMVNWPMAYGKIQLVMDPPLEHDDIPIFESCFQETMIELNPSPILEKIRAGCHYAEPGHEPIVRFWAATKKSMDEEMIKARLMKQWIGGDKEFIKALTKKLQGKNLAYAITLKKKNGENQINLDVRAYPPPPPGESCIDFKKVHVGVWPTFESEGGECVLINRDLTHHMFICSVKKEVNHCLLTVGLQAEPGAGVKGKKPILRGKNLEKEILKVELGSIDVPPNGDMKHVQVHFASGQSNTKIDIFVHETVDGRFDKGSVLRNEIADVRAEDHDQRRLGGSALPQAARQAHSFWRRWLKTLFPQRIRERLFARYSDYDYDAEPATRVDINLDEPEGGYTDLDHLLLEQLLADIGETLHEVV